MSNPFNRPHKLELTRDKSDKREYRWRRRAGNSRIISHSGEGYTNRSNMLHGLELANPDYKNLKIVDLTGDYDSNPQETDDSPSSEA